MCELSWVVIFLGGDFLGGNCPVGIVRVAIFRVGVFLVPPIRVLFFTLFNMLVVFINSIFDF